MARSQPHKRLHRPDIFLPNRAPIAEPPTASSPPPDPPYGPTTPRWTPPAIPRPAPFLRLAPCRTGSSTARGAGNPGSRPAVDNQDLRARGTRGNPEGGRANERCAVGFRLVL